MWAVWIVFEFVVGTIIGVRMERRDNQRRHARGCPIFGLDGE